MGTEVPWETPTVSLQQVIRGAIEYERTMERFRVLSGSASRAIAATQEATRRVRELGETAEQAVRTVEAGLLEESS